MTGTLTNNQRDITTATQTPTRLLRSIALLRRLFMTSAPHERPAQRRHYPPRRSSFLEQAAMAREMRRA